jgi:hypothetical protein
VRIITKQVDIQPGRSRKLGPFQDTSGNQVMVTVRALACGEEGEATTTTEGAEWEIVVPPETVLEVPGLQAGSDRIVLAVLGGDCHETSKDPSTGIPIFDDTLVPPGPLDSHVDVAAYLESPGE